MNTFLASLRDIDYSIFRSINQAAGDNVYLDSAAIFFANYFQYFVICFLFLFILINKKYFRMIIETIFAAAFARFGIVELIRFLHPRFRPFINNYTHLLIDKVNQSSFPSGHASFFFGLAMVVYLHNKKFGILFFAFAFLISIARVFCGVHWPLDILAGAIVGIFSGWLVFKLSKKFIKNKI